MYRKELVIFMITQYKSFKNMEPYQLSYNYSCIPNIKRSCSYGSWIYNYLCNQYLSPLKLWAQTPSMQGVLVTTFCDKNLSVTCNSRWFSPGTLVSSTNKTTVFLCLLNALVHRTHPLSSPKNLGIILVPIYRTQGDSVKHSRQKSSFKR